MRKTLFKKTLVFTCYVLLALFPWSCRLEDHVIPLTCEKVTLVLTACPNGWKIVSTKENGVVSSRSAPYSDCDTGGQGTTQIKFSPTLYASTLDKKEATEVCICPLCGRFNGYWSCKTENGKIFLTYARNFKFIFFNVWTKEIKEMTDTKMVLGSTQNGIAVEETFQCQ
ncbi:MAG: hypothetical protein LH606_13200 [Cytophagaceae bacterium]|nr:hypothetical protein [Cytophagaceae bacterium]